MFYCRHLLLWFLCLVSVLREAGLDLELKEPRVRNEEEDVVELEHGSDPIFSGPLK